jgi:hypothetical protein
MATIKITYRVTSRLSMRIGVDGDLLVSAPKGTPRDKILRFIADHRDWVARATVKVAERRANADRFFGRLPLTGRAEAAEARRRLDAIIMPMVERYSREMGVAPRRISYRATRSKLGSCRKATADVVFSLYLLLFPDWLVEHVVVHELAHLIEDNHGPRFYALMDLHFPRWRDARKATRAMLRDAVGKGAQSGE